LQLFPTFSKLKSILSADIRDIRKIFNLAITDPRAWDTSLWNMLGSQSVSGESVSEHSALTYSAVWDAVGQISSTISTLPLHLLRSDANKTIQATDKRLFRVMHSEFNKYMTAQIGREVLAAHVLTWGNAYAEKVYNGYGEIIELWPITPNRVRMEMKSGELIYNIRVDSQEIPLTRSQILHIPGLGFDGFQGYSVIAMARKSIGLGMAMETFGAMYFGSGTHPGVIVSHPMKLDPITKSNLQTALTQTYSGLGQSHRLMLLEEGMKIENIGVPPEDSQFLESRTFQISDIARWFHIPVHKLKNLERATNNNIESEQSSYYIDCILPWLVRIEQCIDMQLLTETEKWKQKLYFRHNIDGLLRANSKDRATYYKIMTGIGGMTINDVRRKENFDPFPDPYADEPFIAINNMIPLSKVDEWLANQAKSAQPAPSPNVPKEATNANNA
jgi:HK97 family phage portal protein